ncbi:MAG TPA: class I SAM-dependent methyltransferase [Saprospiraceae bacterium]|nr:class I SAM-dependent methyltransferase [Saprospiraceae bacterium]
MIVSNELQAYLDQHLSAVSTQLKYIERQTYLNELQPHMVSGLHQGLFLKMLVHLKSAKNVLEIGTFTGFSAMAMAEALPEDGRLVTIEKDVEMAAKAQANFNKSSQSYKINLRVGDAIDLLDEILDSTYFDLVFIDADKAKNLEYYQTILPRVLSGSLILIDNVLWKGKVMDAKVNDKTTQFFRELNDTIAADERVVACILPIRDGMWFIQKK